MSRVSVRRKRRALPYMHLEGVAELDAKVKQIMLAADDADKVEPVLLKAAEVIEESARAKAPQGPTGNLKRGIRSTLLRRLLGRPAAGAGADYRIAPHAHLVERGTTARRQKTTGRYTGISTAKPFLGPAIAENKGNVMEIIRNGIKRIIEGAV